MKSFFVPVLVFAALSSACGGSNPPAATANASPLAPASARPEEATSKPSKAGKLQLLEASYAALNAHDAKKVAEAYAPDAVVRVAGLNELAGREKIAADLEEWMTTFAGVKVGARHVWAKGDLLAVEWVLRGTHSGEIFGVKGTNVPVGHVGFSLFTFDANGQVAREHRFGDLGSVLEQIRGRGGKSLPEIPNAPDVGAASNDAEEDANATVAKELYRALEERNEKAFLSRLGESIEYEGHLATVHGTTDAKAFFAAFTSAFPDAKFEIERAVGVGTCAIVEYTLRATHKGKILEYPATGRRVTVHAVDVIEMRGGKVKRAATYSNGLELWSQLGDAGVWAETTAHATKK